MVDWYGRWTYEPDTPEDKKSDSDRLADWIISIGYVPKTSIEHLVDMVWLHYENDCDEINIKDVIEFVKDSGISEFDYEP